VSRDLPAELVAFLEVHPGAVTSEIVPAVHARKADVLRILEQDERFANVLAGPGRPANARAWQLAGTEPLFRPHGNSGNRASGVEAPSDPSGGPRAGRAATVAAAPPCGRLGHERHHWQAPNGALVCALCEEPPSLSAALARGAAA
jgi:hypothetical protein